MNKKKLRSGKRALNNNAGWPLRAVTGSAWAGLWYSRNKLDGVTRHLLYFNGVIALFSTQRKAKEFIERKYGYIRTRKDLRNEPHGWRLPQPIRVSVTPNEKGQR